MRHIAMLLLAATPALQMSPLGASQLTGAATQSQTVIGGSIVATAGQAQISGTVVTPDGEALVNTTVRARNLLTGEIGGSTSTATGGQFTISLNPGSYMLEIVDAGGQIVGTSAFISAAAGAAVAAATVTATTGVLSAVGGATGLVATLGATAASSVTTAAAAAAVAGVVVPPNAPIASPSR